MGVFSSKDPEPSSADRYAAARERDRLAHVAECKRLGLVRQAVNAMTSDEVRAEVARSTDLQGGGRRG